MEQLIQALKKIEQMSDCGSYENAIVNMKAIATEALKSTPMEQLTEQKIIDTIIKWCEGATDNVADGVRFKEVAKELSESTPKGMILFMADIVVTEHEFVTGNPSDNADPQPQYPSKENGYNRGLRTGSYEFFNKENKIPTEAVNKEQHATNFFYCQAEIEGAKMCEYQCNQCAEYYAPLEREVEPEEGKEDESVIWTDLYFIIKDRIQGRLNGQEYFKKMNQFNITRKTKGEEWNNDAVSFARYKDEFFYFRRRPNVNKYVRIADGKQGKEITLEELYKIYQQSKL